MDTHELSRRSFLRAAGGLAGLLFAMGMTDALEPDMADALDVPVNFQVLKRINYAGGFTNEFRVNGNLAFCCNPSYYNPPSGIFHEVHDDVAWDSNAWNNPSGTLLGDVRWQLRQTLWLGVEGPAYNEAFFPARWYDGSGMNWDTRYVCEHILLSDLYALDFQAAVAGTTQQFKTWALNNVTGIAHGGGLIPGSMRAHISADKDGGDSSRFSVADPSFMCYIMNAGWDSAHGQNYQRIMTFESKGKLVGKKNARHGNWL